MSTTPEALERIFQRVEEETERRARSQENRPATLTTATRSEVSSLVSTSTRERRRGSISVSRFGQVSEEDQLSYSRPGSSNDYHTGPRKMSSLASHSAFYQRKIKNGSVQSLATTESGDEAGGNGGVHEEDMHHSTQIEQIAARQTLPKAMGKLIPRRLSRTLGSSSSSFSSASPHHIISSSNGTNVVVGVSIEEATTTHHAEDKDEDDFHPVKVHTGGRLNTKPSTQSMASEYTVEQKERRWTLKAIDFTRVFRRKSKVDFSS